MMDPSWQDRLDAYFRRLVQCYGRERTVEICAGRNPAANADLAKWRRLGFGPCPRPAA